jgi:hypothetical protein
MIGSSITVLRQLEKILVVIGLPFVSGCHIRCMIAFLYHSYMQQLLEMYVTVGCPLLGVVCAVHDYFSALLYKTTENLDCNWMFTLWGCCLQCTIEFQHFYMQQLLKILDCY